MVDPKLLAYVRTQTAAHYSVADIEHAAIEAGWAAEDVAAAFVALHSATPWATATPAAPHYEISPARMQTLSASRSDGPKGLIGLVMRTGLVSTESQATIVLAGVLVVVVGSTVWTLWPRGGGPPPAAPTLNAMPGAPAVPRGH